MDWAKDLPFDVPVVGERRRGPERGRVPVLGRLRGGVRGPGQEDHPGRRRAAAHRRRLVRGARQRRDLHAATRPGGRATSSSSSSSPRRTPRRCARPGRPRSSRPARTASTRSRTSTRSSGVELEVVHHTQLLNRLVRDGKLTPVAPADPASAAGRSPTTTPAIWAGTTRSTTRRASCSGAARRDRRRDAAAPASAPSAAAPAAPGCGWRRSSAPGSTPTGPRR